MVFLTTERLNIRDHMPADLNAMHTLLSDPVAMLYLPEIKTTTFEETRTNLETAINEAGQEKRVKYFFAIEMKETGQYVGEIGFTVTLDTPVGLVVQLGYFILPKFWRQAIVTEAAKRVIQFAFEETKTIKIVTGCIKENVGSEGVMIKLGLVKEGEFKKHVWHEGQLKDRVEYRLLREEWAATIGEKND